MKEKEEKGKSRKNPINRGEKTVKEKRKILKRRRGDITSKQWRRERRKKQKKKKRGNGRGEGEI